LKHVPFNFFAFAFDGAKLLPQRVSFRAREEKHEEIGIVKTSRYGDNQFGRKTEQAMSVV